MLAEHPVRVRNPDNPLRESSSRDEGFPSAKKRAAPKLRLPGDSDGPLSAPKVQQCPPVLSGFPFRHFGLDQVPDETLCALSERKLVSQDAFQQHAYRRVTCHIGSRGQRR